MRIPFALLSVAAFGATIAARGLSDAVKRGDTAAVAAMLKVGADVNLSEPDGTTALHWAAHRNDLETADLLLRAGAKPAAVNSYGDAVISETAAVGSPPTLDQLFAAA